MRKVNMTQTPFSWNFVGETKAIKLRNSYYHRHPETPRMLHGRQMLSHPSQTREVAFAGIDATGEIWG